VCCSMPASSNRAGGRPDPGASCARNTFFHVLMRGGVRVGAMLNAQTPSSLELIDRAVAREAETYRNDVGELRIPCLACWRTRSSLRKNVCPMSNRMSCESVRGCMIAQSSSETPTRKASWSTGDAFFQKRNHTRGATAFTGRFEKSSAHM